MMMIVAWGVCWTCTTQPHVDFATNTSDGTGGVSVYVSVKGSVLLALTSRCLTPAGMCSAVPVD